uniref:Uncharacterized protein n=1 Tax=viral metagenome TaxID=1070528 RepID=A0A6C0J5F6_9ZZZZ
MGCLEYNHMSTLHKMTRLLIVDYKNKTTTSETWLNSIYKSKQLYFNSDSLNIMCEIMAPRFSDNLRFCSQSHRFIGSKIDLIEAKYRLNKFTIISRSMGSIISHMIFFAAYKAMMDIGYSVLETMDLLSCVVSLDFGFIINPEDRLTYFKHYKFMGSNDIKAQEKLIKYKLSSVSLNATMINVQTLIEPVKITSDGIKG